MAFVRFVTHPQVRISADIPVPFWGLSDVGRRRAEALIQQPWMSCVGRLISSAETKALETAAIVAGHTGLHIEVRASTHENDRSSTGFVPPGEFEKLADAFFAQPDEQIQGWESSRKAQQRIVHATLDLFSGLRDPLQNHGADVVIIGHGAVGTLLLCHLLGIAISRSEDQVGGDAAAGGGNYWSYDLDKRLVVHRWKPIEPF
jgi:broad specificity phosphatase PhoE